MTTARMLEHLVPCPSKEGLTTTIGGVPRLPGPGEGLAAALQEGTLSLVAGSGDRGLVGRGRLVGAAQSAQQGGLDGVEQVVAAQAEGVQQAQRRLRAVDLSHRDRPVQRGDRAGGYGQELV